MYPEGSVNPSRAKNMLQTQTRKAENDKYLLVVLAFIDHESHVQLINLTFGILGFSSVDE